MKVVPHVIPAQAGNHEAYEARFKSSREAEFALFALPVDGPPACAGVTVF